MRHIDICRCAKCGRLFDGRDCKKVEESRGEFWGFPAFETMWYSPCCTDDYHELTNAELRALSNEEKEEWNIVTTIEMATLTLSGLQEICKLANMGFTIEVTKNLQGDDIVFAKNSQGLIRIFLLDITEEEEDD